MKKKVIKRKYRELPKYALGTMKPIDLGYQPGRGIGSAQMTTQPGVSLDPETQAVKANTWPTAVNSLMQQMPFIKNNLDYYKESNATKTTNVSLQQTLNKGLDFSLTNPLSNFAVNGKMPLWALKDSTTLASSIGTSGAGALSGGASALGTTAGSSFGSFSGTGFGGLGETNASTFFGTKALENTGSQTASSGASAGSNALKIGGKALGAIGAAYGLANMGMQIGNFGSHRTAADMFTNMGRQFYTTDKGNTYDAYTGPNINQELAYENANARSKQTNWALSSIGTGASIGSLFSPIGTAIGALGGAIVGGLGSLFGWGDNEEEVKREAKMLADTTAMYNRQQRAVAESKDTSAEFNDRVGTAAEGKESYGPMQTKNGDDINTPRFIFDVNAKNKVGIGVPMSKLMPKETVLDKSTGNWGRVPGKGNKDIIYSNVAPGDAHVVFTNKGGISDLAAGVLKSNAPEKLKQWQLNELENMQADLRESEQEQKNMKKYKNGKLPGFANGLDYMFPAAANLFSLIGLNSERNRVKNATFPMYPGVPENPGATRAIDILGNRRFNADPILKQLHNTYRQSLYDINRMPGLGAGGQVIARANAAIQKNRQAAEILGKADEINNQYIADYANAIRDYGNRMQDLMVANNAQRMSLWQQQNAAKENWLAENTRSMSNVIGGLAKDLLGANQFHRAQDYQERMLDLYGRNLDLESQKILNDIYQRQLAGNIKPKRKNFTVII